jgi:purine-nucleoside phosphorylase
VSPVHVHAEPGDFPESVLLPGDPRKANYIAETFFEDAKLVTE